MLQRIGRYEILERIGRGGQGTVYRANDTSLDRIVAVKVIDNPAVDDPNYMEALQREARLAASLSHPNIVTVHDFQIEGEIPYIVMEFVPNSLERLIRTGGPIGYERAVEIARNICLGLAHAHSEGVIHRDIKPANILIDSDGNAQITDFGIARAIISSTQAPQTGAAGTFHYMPPEQWESANINLRADIYSVGVTLFQMITGSVPFDGSGPGEIFLKHRDDPTPPIPSNLSVPSAIGDIVRRAMEKNPRDRFGSADSMATALSRAGSVDSSSLSGTPGSIGEPPPGPSPPPIPPIARSRPDGDLAGGFPRRFVLGGLVSVVAIIAIIGVIIGLVSSGDDNTSAMMAVPPNPPVGSVVQNMETPTAAPTKRPTAVPTKIPTAVPTRSTSLGYFTIGSTKDEVLVIMGTPNNFTNSLWWYGNSSVSFAGDLVTKWNNFGQQLDSKARMVS